MYWLHSVVAHYIDLKQFFHPLPPAPQILVLINFIQCYLKTHHLTQCQLQRTRYHTFFVNSLPEIDEPFFLSENEDVRSVKFIPDCLYSFSGNWRFYFPKCANGSDELKTLQLLLLGKIKRVLCRKYCVLKNHSNWLLQFMIFTKQVISY